MYIYVYIYIQTEALSMRKQISNKNTDNLATQ